MNWQSRKQLLLQLLSQPLDIFFPVFEKEINPDSEFYDEYIQHKSRYSETIREERIGTISREAKDLAYNRIRAGLVEVCGMMEAADFHPTLSLDIEPEWKHLLTTPTRQTKRLRLFAVIGIAAVCIFGILIWQMTSSSATSADDAAASQIVDFYGTLTDSQNRLLPNASLQIGPHIFSTDEKGRFRTQLPLSADTIISIRIFVYDSLIYDKRNPLRSPFDRKMPYP